MHNMMPTTIDPPAGARQPAFGPLRQRRVLRLAQHTPSWCDTQPWHTVITQGDGTARLREALLAHVDTDAPVNTFRTTRADLDEAVSFVSE
ncbi:hypothetical protein ACPXCG_11965 [Gordonia sp. DT218]|uniref:hypothetical protein n=1 Tax=Gordonia sp. DT218 TaxID=3416659 RepID=UPI003CF9B344